MARMMILRSRLGRVGRNLRVISKIRAAMLFDTQPVKGEINCRLALGAPATRCLWIFLVNRAEKELLPADLVDCYPVGLSLVEQGWLIPYPRASSG